MKSYDELKAEMETIQQQMAEAKKSERTNALKEERTYECTQRSEAAMQRVWLYCWDAQWCFC